ncbi:hypothetical protein [Paraflavitalea speifideaquila]|uniref:hypothetical protein n=1 Tax=Paraflavitalea speifideaquila TaxID=3076558 RepID=UPI0028E282C0|nr:hypothetical protein [Paraflavitalea speifideiaquila]
MEEEKEYLPVLLLLYPKEKQEFKTLWNEFKYSYHLGDVRELLAQCLETCLCSGHSNFSDPLDRSNIAFFIGELMALLEAKYLKEINRDEQYRQFTTGKKKQKPDNTHEDNLPDQ